MVWLNEPPEWQQDDRTLSLVTGAETDFWRHTHYGFVRDSGHFWHTRREGDFTATVRFDGEYEALYDQAGLMIRLDEEVWIKAGIEFTDGLRQLSVVSTRGHSDWSVVPVEDTAGPIELRLSRLGDAVRIDRLVEGGSPRMIRLAYFPPDGPATIGPMACSPTRAGFRARFQDFHLGPPISKELHAD